MINKKFNFSDHLNSIKPTFSWELNKFGRNFDIRKKDILHGFLCFIGKHVPDENGVTYIPGIVKRYTCCKHCGKVIYLDYEDKR